MKYITDSSVEDIERYLDSSYAMNYLDIGSGIELRVCQEFCVNRFNKQHRIAA